MLPFDKAKSLQAHKFSQYSNDYKASGKPSPGFSRRILSAVQSSLKKVRANRPNPKIA